MAEQDEKDRQIHENLHAISQHLDLPKRPSSEKRDKWQKLLSSTQPRPRINVRGVNLMRRHRTLTMIGSGALAASVLLAVFLVSSSSTDVSAAMILTDLRLALGKSILVHFQNIELDYAELAKRVPTSQLKRGTLSCDGRVFVRSQPLQEAFWALEDIRMQGLATSAKGGEGFNAVAEWKACLREERPWFFIQMGEPPAVAPARSSPQSSIPGMFRGGVYVTLPSLAFEAEEGDSSSQVRIISPEFVQLHDLKHVLGRLEEMATDIEVSETEPALFVLTARGFHEAVALPGLSPSVREGLEAWLRDMMKDQIVEVGYRLDEGVRWISVRHFGKPAGRIDIQLADVEFDTRLFDLDYHLERRSAPVVDASAMLKLVGMFDRPVANGP